IPCRSASLPSDESSSVYQTVRPWLVPRYSGNVTVPSAFSTALFTKRVRPPSAAASPGRKDRQTPAPTAAERNRDLKVVMPNLRCSGEALLECGLRAPEVP